MNVTQHQRPGVYSVYDASSALAANQGGKTAAVAAVSVQGEPGKPRLFTGYDQAAEAFGADSDLARAIDLLLQNGAAKVYAVPVAAESGYPDAFAALEGARSAEPEKAKKYAQVLFNQAKLIAGLPITDPSGYTDLLCSLWA